MRRVLAVAAVVAFTGPIGLRADAARWWAHVEALANDGMDGRNTGSAGDKRAADYIAAQFQRAGLEPAGIGGYLQPIAFKTRRIVESQSSLALVRSGQDRAADARRRRQHQHARRSVALRRRAAGVCRLRAARARARHQRPAGTRSEGRGGRLPGRGAGGAARPAAGARRVGRRALEDVEGRRRDRHDQHRQPEDAWRSRGRGRRSRGCSRRCRSPIPRSTRRPASSCR